LRSTNAFKSVATFVKQVGAFARADSSRCHVARYQRTKSARRSAVIAGDVRSVTPAEATRRSTRSSAALHFSESRASLNTSFAGSPREANRCSRRNEYRRRRSGRRSDSGVSRRTVYRSAPVMEAREDLQWRRETPESEHWASRCRAEERILSPEAPALRKGQNFIGHPPHFLAACAQSARRTRVPDPALA
jgi:hypothetical protein